ncbi:hypothetical protein PHYSODRAFT_307554 [Phytophthora sojae]|uniref:BZIP domain-containing protein n=1 Tax=Phytophthora sojae (strain P6497) TaxID=1094619 RepID=G5AF42_PHYSP|nr:hypothetical protein PHYSODRAFT_307554 [Phytophthora sojae]EGZ05832.1 hypothetical protein PHYSODRAFT_307554 [Phytophthora sojae]|eukprot:XP_009538693.1 hypothetical protein PHYSODRAFT_307554 [Phytophthora sojae]
MAPQECLWQRAVLQCLPSRRSHDLCTITPLSLHTTAAQPEFSCIGTARLKKKRVNAIAADGPGANTANTGHAFQSPSDPHNRITKTPPECAACVLPSSERMDQRNYGIPAGRGVLPGGLPQQQQQQQRAPQPGMQQHYGMQDMMFDPLSMSNGMYHQAPPLGGQMMHQQHPGPRAGGMQALGGLMPQQGMVAPEDDLDDLMSALGDPVGMNAQQQQSMGHMPSHVYNQSHLVPPRSQAPTLQAGRTQGLPLPSQAPPMQQGMPGSMHMNQMAPNAGARMGGVGLQQQGMGAPPATSSIGGLGGLAASIPAPTAPRQAAVAPSAIVPTSTKSSTSSRALATSSNNGGSSDEDAGMGEDDAQKKKERRRQQVRYASRRRRKKQKDEESFLRDRIAELKEQIRIIGGDLTEQCSQMAGMSEQALTEAYEKQMQTVQTLRKDNNKLKEQLLQHENFARMIQYGLNALPSDCRDVDRKKIAGVPMWISDQMNPLKGPTLVVDLNLCHEAVRHAYNELKTFGPTVNSKTNVCYAMGWKTELWAASTCLNFRAVRSISDKNIREVADASWEIITSPDKFKRIYPDVKQFRILQKVTDDIVVVHRIASVASDMSDREFISVAFRFRDGDNYFIGIKSITVQTEAAENCIRGEECQGWMFVGGENETSQWKAHFLGYYDVKGEKDDKVLNQLANEAMFGMLRWESEAMHPLSV